MARSYMDSITRVRGIKRLQVYSPTPERPALPPAPDGPEGPPIGENLVYFEDLLAGKAKGRTSAEQITYSERGNIQGTQFCAVAGAVYERARAAGLGRELPTEWFLQDIRD